MKKTVATLNHSTSLISNSQKHKFVPQVNYSQNTKQRNKSDCSNSYLIFCDNKENDISLYNYNKNNNSVAYLQPTTPSRCTPNHTNPSKKNSLSPSNSTKPNLSQFSDKNLSPLPISKHQKQQQQLKNQNKETTKKSLFQAVPKRLSQYINQGQNDSTKQQKQVQLNQNQNVKKLKSIELEISKSKQSRASLTPIKNNNKLNSQKQYESTLKIMQYSKTQKKVQPNKRSKSYIDQKQSLDNSFKVYESPLSQNSSSVDQETNNQQKMLFLDYFRRQASQYSESNNQQFHNLIPPPLNDVKYFNQNLIESVRSLAEMVELPESIRNSEQIIDMQQQIPQNISISQIIKIDKSNLETIGEVDSTLENFSSRNDVHVIKTLKELELSNQEKNVEIMKLALEIRDLNYKFENIQKSNQQQGNSFQSNNQFELNQIDQPNLLQTKKLLQSDFSNIIQKILSYEQIQQTVNNSDIIMNQPTSTSISNLKYQYVLLKDNIRQQIQYSDYLYQQKYQTLLCQQILEDQTKPNQSSKLNLKANILDDFITSKSFTGQKIKHKIMSQTKFQNV